MVDLERCGVLFFMRFFCLFFAEEPYFFMNYVKNTRDFSHERFEQKYKHRRDAFFPMQDMSAIVAKQWDANGTIRKTVYKPFNEQMADSSSDDKKSK